MTQPSVGRVVHYMARGSADGVFPVACRAAIVTAVNEPDQLVSLAVLHPDGLLFAQAIPEGVPYGTSETRGGTWHWPERV